MTELKDLKVPEDWLKVIYAEAWNQYTHEDNLGQSRTNFFLGIQAALVAIFTALSGSLVQIGSYPIGGYKFNLGFVLLGVAALVIGGFSLISAKHWQAVTKAGRQYLNLRWIPLAVIEKLAQIDQIGLAGIEDRWRTFSQQNPGIDYYPFKNIQELEDFRLSSLQKTRGWDSMLKVILFLQVIYYFIIGLGVIFIVIAFL